MAEEIRVVIIDEDDKAREFLKKSLDNLEDVHVAGEAMKAGNGYELVSEIRPEVVILDITSDSSLNLAKRITENLPEVVLFTTSLLDEPGLILKAMRAGSREFLLKPIKPEELFAAFQNFRRFNYQRKSVLRRPAKIITVFGVKGGVGSTTVATNLAVTLAQEHRKSVILLDLNLQLGNSALFLDIKPKYSIIDIVYSIDEIDPAQLKGSLPRHPSGVSLLGGPYQIEEAETVNVNQLDRLLILLRSIFDYIIIDTHKIFDEFIIKSLDESDSILMVFTLDIPSMYNARRCLDVFKKMGYLEDKIRLVTNRFDSRNIIAFEQFEKSVNHAVFWKIPNQDFDTMIKSINLGTPLAIMDPRSRTSQSFKELAAKVSGADEPLSNGTEARGLVSSIKKVFSGKTAEKFNGASESTEGE